MRLPGAPRAAWRLALPDRLRLGLDARGIPAGPSTPVPAEEKLLDGLAFDHGYEGLAEGAGLALSDGTRRVLMRLMYGYPAAQVFAPPGRDVISLEPMTAPTDALRSGRGLPWATPDAPFRARFELVVGAERPGRSASARN